MNKYTVICNLTMFESAEIEAESIEEAIRLATENPDDYDWNNCGECQVEYEKL